MSENTIRPAAVWRERGDALHTMECSNCGADAHYQIVAGVWRYEPYCAHCGARVYKQEDLPMSENKKPRLAEILNVEVGEKFKIKGYFDSGSPFGEIVVFQLLEDGTYTTTPAMCPGSAAALLQSIDQPERIIHIPRWTEREVEIAKAIKLLAPAMDYIERISENRSELYSKLDFGAAYLPIPCIPSMKPGERIALNDIIGGRE